MAAKDSSSFRMSALPVTILAHLLAIAFISLMLVWTIKFQGGLAFKSVNKEKIFNIHPVLMIIGLIFVGGEAIMAYKTVPSRRKVQKSVHLILHLIALLIGIVGVYAIFKFHHELHLASLRTLHSWFGIATITLYGLQWLLAAFSFWFPGAAMPARARLVPWHWFAGMVIFLTATCTAETGLVRFTVPGVHLSSEFLILNFTGLLVLLFAITVVLSVILREPR